jgi:hypothetical protein
MTEPKKVMRAHAAAQRTGARLVWLTLRYHVDRWIMTGDGKGALRTGS